MKAPFFITVFLSLFFFQASGQPVEVPVWLVKKTNDFLFSGDGASQEWTKTDWVELSRRKNDQVAYQTAVKLLYSETGIYCLFRCEDQTITATMKENFLDLWNEDVVEAFFWPDRSFPVYFEYELSPLNYELPILVPNHKGEFLGWRPWHYEGERKTRHATHIHKNADEIQSWTAEFFIPFVLLKPLPNSIPKKGSRWRANFYRVDYDQGTTSWSWAPVRTNFHDYERFGILVFDE